MKKFIAIYCEKKYSKNLEKNYSNNTIKNLKPIF